jgi:hypothetical protein
MRSCSASLRIVGERRGRELRSGAHAPDALIRGRLALALTHRLTVAGDTQKRAAARFCEPSTLTISTNRRLAPGPSRQVP